MVTYTVTWVIDIEADTPKEAAEQAQQIQRDPHSIATVFTVIDEEGVASTIDLLGLDAILANFKSGGNHG